MTALDLSREPFAALELLDYQEGAVVSRILAKKSTGSVTLFAFDFGQGLSEHTAPMDAFVHILEGEAEITLGGVSHRLWAGHLLLLPAGIPHAVQAIRRFKMILTMLRES